MIITNEGIKPPTYHYSYSNPASQGALITQSNMFPLDINYPCGAYVDSWDSTPYSRDYALEYHPKKKRKSFDTYTLGKDEKVSSAYSDRIASWDRQRFGLLCKMAGGDQNWAYSLPKFSEKKKLEFAKLALGIETEVISMRAVHYFNVSNGYSCPAITAIYKK